MIQMLPPEVADAIAAGEVIERPASVVKELVENAIDGGARRISIDVRGAGKTSIRVSDDGAGIPADELPLAFVRHTTSKLTRLADLIAIQSFGFRGEALASIAAVADVECSSAGATLRIRAGELIEQGAGPLLPGVVVEVRDLFANVPARLKFLKSDATEVAVIKDVVSAFALLHPHIRFHLTVDSRAAVSSSGDGDRRRAVAAVFGPPVASECPWSPAWSANPASAEATATEWCWRSMAAPSARDRWSTRSRSATRGGSSGAATRSRWSTSGSTPSSSTSTCIRRRRKFAFAMRARCLPRCSARSDQPSMEVIRSAIDP